jgi:hypothetical protein
VHYSCEATANRAPGQPMVFMAPRTFESAPVVENMEVAAATGGGGGHSGGNVSSRTDRKRKAPGKPSGGCIRHSGWYTNET